MSMRMEGLPEFDAWPEQIDGQLAWIRWDGTQWVPIEDDDGGAPSLP